MGSEDPHQRQRKFWLYNYNCQVRRHIPANPQPIVEWKLCGLALDYVQPLYHWRMWNKEIPLKTWQLKIVWLGLDQSLTLKTAFNTTHHPFVGRFFQLDRKSWNQIAWVKRAEQNLLIQSQLICVHWSVPGYFSELLDHLHKLATRPQFPSYFPHVHILGESLILFSTHILNFWSLGT